jgi:hypothetical protein
VHCPSESRRMPVDGLWRVGRKWHMEHNDRKTRVSGSEVRRFILQRSSAQKNCRIRSARDPFLPNLRGHRAIAHFPHWL